MKAYILRLGATHHDINTSFALFTQAKRDNPDPETVWYTSPSYAVLISHPEVGWILYDLGPAADSEESWPKCLSNGCHYVSVLGETMEEQLAQLDLKPSDINYVVISHMHMDHIGNIQMFKETATFFVSRADAQHAFTAVMCSTDVLKHGFYNRSDVLAEMKELNYIEEEDDEFELFPGIRTVLLPGHTPAVLGLILEMEEQNLLLVSDALFTERSYDGWMPGTVYDTASWRRSLAKIKRLEKKYRARILFGHSTDGLKQLPDFYK